MSQGDESSNISLYLLQNMGQDDENNTISLYLLQNMSRRGNQYYVLNSKNVVFVAQNLRKYVQKVSGSLKTIVFIVAF